MSELLGSPGAPGIERACLLWMLLIDGDLAILGLPGPCPPPGAVKVITKFELETALWNQWRTCLQVNLGL